MKYKREITHIILGIISGLIYLVSLYWIAELMHNLIGLNVNLLDPIQHFYTAYPLVIVGIILWTLKRKYIGIGTVLSYPMFVLAIFILFAVACTIDVGNCL